MKKLLVFAVLGLLYLAGCSDSLAERPSFPARRNEAG
jgi:outer membrane murein-binding lipoprotein Lpp